jgi:hypothetical protein
LDHSGSPISQRLDSYAFSQKELGAIIRIIIFITTTITTTIIIIIIITNYSIRVVDYDFAKFYDFYNWGDDGSSWSLTFE